MSTLLEVCVDSPDGLDAAVAGGADRIELCSALALGGLTPSPSMIAKAARCGRPALAMIRPRAGGFVWSAGEVAAMEEEIAIVGEAGLAGVVVGANLPDGRLDLDALLRLKAAARGMELTLHRGFDLVPDRASALESVIRLGFTRLLSSGGAARAEDAMAELVAMYWTAKNWVEVMPGAGITAANVRRFLDAAPFASIHASCSAAVADDPRAVALGFAPPARRETSEAEVRATRAALDAG